MCGYVSSTGTDKESQVEQGASTGQSFCPRVWEFTSAPATSAQPTVPAAFDSGSAQPKQPHLKRGKGERTFRWPAGQDILRCHRLAVTAG